MAPRGRSADVAAVAPRHEPGTWPVWGHERQTASLRQALAANRLSHATVIAGPEGVGKRAVALALAQAMLCREPGRDDPTVPCGHCPGCVRVRRGTHPDVEVHSLATQAALADRGGKNTGITIETARTLRASTALKPMEGTRRLIVLDDAETMPEPAQEALLKTLEEPPSAVTLLLLASDAALLLPTIRSRCQLVDLGPVPVATIVAGLEASGVDPDTAGAIAALSRGRVGWALRAAGDPAVLEARRQAIASAVGWVAGSGYDRAVAAHRLGERFSKDRAAVFDEVETVVGVWRDALLHQAGLGPHAGFADESAAVRQVADALAAMEIVAALRATQRCLADLEANVRPKLAIETMVLAWPITSR